MAGGGQRFFGSFQILAFDQHIVRIEGRDREDRNLPLGQRL